MNTDTSLTSDESDDENEDDRIRRETSLISLRKRRRIATSDDWNTIRHYLTDEDGSSHSNPKIRSRDPQSNGTKQFSRISDSHNDKSSTGEEEIVDDDEEIVDNDEEIVDNDEEIVDNDEEIVDNDEEIVDNDEEIVNDEVASSERNVTDDSNESRYIRSNVNEKSFVWTTKAEAVHKNVGQQNNDEFKCIGNESLVDDIRIEGADSRNKLFAEIDDVVQLTTVRDTHEGVPGCNQSTTGIEMSAVRTNNDQPTGTAQEKQKSQMTQTTLSSFNRLQGEISEDSEGDNFHRDLPFGCLIVYDSYNSRVPSQIILSSLDENVRKLKKM